MINYPDINPVAISIPFSGFWGNSIDIHWYALAYVVGAYLIYFHMLSTRKKFGINLDNEKVSDLVITYGLFFGAVMGGRLGHVLFYDFHLQLQDPIYFLKIWEGGMSFHGGLIGVMVAIYFFAKSNGYKFFQISDWLCVSVPIALFLGRIANFINAELYGRPTDISWGMIFPSDPDQLVRHPSQIYEAMLEGFLLFLILNFVIKSKKIGTYSAFFLIGYAVARFIVEIFKQPDYVWGGEFLLLSFLTQGQLLSIPMLILGLVILYRNNESISRFTKKS